MNNLTLYNKSCFDMSELPDNSIQCIVTSPPYWGLRKYKAPDLIFGGDNHHEHEWGKTLKVMQGAGNKTPSGFQQKSQAGQSGGLSQTRWSESNNGNACSICGAWKGQYGLEPTVELYVQHTIEWLREARRVLRPDGCLFLNLGDSYWAGKGSNGSSKARRTAEERGYIQSGGTLMCDTRPQDGKDPTIKPKDLCLIPFRVALAAQSDGWWVRSAIIWNKPNPMPESVTDRPTDAYEFIFLLTKSARYYWDAEAVREEATGFDGRKDTLYKGGPKDMACGEHERWKRKNDGTGYGGDGTGFQDHSGYSNMENPYVRNMRNVWTFPTQPYPEAHFATFPEELPERCIKAATPEYGCCDKCGRPWERIIEREKPPSQVFTAQRNPEDGLVCKFNHDGKKVGSGQKLQNWLDEHPPKTLGWQQGCKCENSKPVPSSVLDPFAGSGTTLYVASKQDRQGSHEKPKVIAIY